MLLLLAVLLPAVGGVVGVVVGVAVVATVAINTDYSNSLVSVFYWRFCWWWRLCLMVLLLWLESRTTLK